MWICGSPGIAPNGSAPTASYCSQTPSGIFTTANRMGTGSYDPAGNQLSIAGSNLTYDAENRITKATQPGIGYVDYGYDGNGRRVFKSNSYGSRTIYVYDAEGKLVAEYSLGVGSVSPCQTCYLSLDHLGSTRLVTDQNGNTVSRHDYIPFGEEIPANTAGRDSTFGTQDFVNQKFTGKERDQETGLDYFGARYYGSALGRFTSPDEFKGGIVDPFTGQDIETNTALPYADITDPQTLNKYAYVRNNPLRYADPTGHCFWDACIAEGYATYVAVGAIAAGAVYLSTPQGQQALRDTATAVANGINGLVTLATNNNSSQQAQPPGPADSQTQPEAQSGDKPTYAPTKENVDRMKQGKAPVGNDGNPVELHHQDQNPQGRVKEMTRTDHRGPGNYSENHPEGNKQPSRIDRNEAARQRRQYWKDKARRHEDQ